MPKFPTGADRVKALQVADRVARARPPREDASGACHEAIAEIARATGRDVADLLEQWSERAAVRQYLGGVTRDEAERLAVEDVRQ